MSAGESIPKVYSLEGLPVADYRAWLAQRREEAAKKAAGVAALDAYESLASRESLAESDLSPILEAARSRYFVSWDIGLQFLCRLGARHEVARQAMRELFLAGRADLRGRVLACVHDRLPKPFCIELVRRGLADRSKNVRGTAANVCRGYLLAELLPDLARAAENETDAATAFEMSCAIALIRDGYFVYRRPDGSQALMVRISDGFPAETMWPGPDWWPNSNVDDAGARSIAAQVRQLHGRTPRPFRWDAEAAERSAAADPARGVASHDN
jgi:hypothetical protein